MGGGGWRVRGGGRRAAGERERERERGRRRGRTRGRGEEERRSALHWTHANGGGRRAARSGGGAAPLPPPLLTVDRERSYAALVLDLRRRAVMGQRASRQWQGRGSVRQAGIKRVSQRDGVALVRATSRVWGFGLRVARRAAAAATSATRRSATPFSLGLLPVAVGRSPVPIQGADPVPPRRSWVVDAKLGRRPRATVAPTQRLPPQPNAAAAARRRRPTPPDPAPARGAYRSGCVRVGALQEGNHCALAILRTPNVHDGRDRRVRATTLAQIKRGGSTNQRLRSALRAWLEYRFARP